MGLTFFFFFSWTWSRLKKILVVDRDVKHTYRIVYFTMFQKDVGNRKEAMEAIKSRMSEVKDIECYLCHVDLEKYYEACRDFHQLKRHLQVCCMFFFFYLFLVSILCCLFSVFTTSNNYKHLFTSVISISCRKRF